MKCLASEVLSYAPPVMQNDSIEHNKLVRPRVIRELTIRPNIHGQPTYGAYDTSRGSSKSGADILAQKQIFYHVRDRIVRYCQSREDVGKPGDMLGCPKSTSKSVSEEEKVAICSSWL